MPQDIEFFETNQLVDELQRRTDAGVIVLHRDKGKGGSEEQISYHGGVHRAYALASQAQQGLRRLLGGGRI